MSFLDDVLAGTSLEEVRATVIGYAAASELPITEWIVGGTGQQIFEAVTEVVYFVSQIVTRVTRGFVSLDTSTDPGDPDTFYPGNEALPAEAGFLSYLGENGYGTTRAGETFASGFVDFANDGIVARTFSPRGLVFTWTANTPPTPAPTYRNADDSTIYTNTDGTVTVLAGATLRIPVEAEERGIRSNAPANSLSLTTTLVGCSATNAASVTAVAREDAEVYRGRCRKASARLSFAGPADAVEYLSAKTLDGDPLTNASGNIVNISRAQVTNDSATGEVEAYYASPSGAATSEDVDAANDNIELNTYAIGDCITFTGSAATETTISVVGTARIRARTGLPSSGTIAQAIVDALTTAFAAFPVGGVDQVAGAGVVYKVDLQAIAAAAYPGLYDVVVTTPAGASTAIALGHVAVLDCDAADWTVTIVT